MGECALPSGHEWSSLNDSKPCTWSPSHLSDLSTFRGVSLKEAPPGHHQLTNSTPTKIFLNPIIFIFTDTMWAMRFPVWTSERRICVSDSSFLLICSFVRAGVRRRTRRYSLREVSKCSTATSEWCLFFPLHPAGGDGSAYDPPPSWLVACVSPLICVLWAGDGYKSVLFHSLDRRVLDGRTASASVLSQNCISCRVLMRFQLSRAKISPTKSSINLLWWTFFSFWFF